MSRGSRSDRALQLVRDVIEHVLEVCECRGFVEITGKTGGDTVTFRVYDDGTVCER